MIVLFKIQFKIEISLKVGIAQTILFVQICKVNK
jgi:hypothetical protein